MRKVTYKAIAEIVGCSPSMVSRVLNQNRSADTRLGKKIKIAAELYESKLNEQLKIEHELRRELREKIKKETK